MKCDELENSKHTAQMVMQEIPNQSVLQMFSLLELANTLRNI